MKSLQKLLVLFVAAVCVSAASAQIRSVQGSGSNLIVGAIPSQSTFVIGSGWQWSTVPNNSVVAAGTAFSAGISSGGGVNSYTTNGLFQPATYFGNASLRGLIRGWGFTYPSPGISITATFYAGSPVTVTIWGPTLNNYGVVGATGFSWTITSSAGTTSGSGEVDSTGHSGSITVTVEPWTFSAGDVLIQTNG